VVSELIKNPLPLLFVLLFGHETPFPKALQVA